ncbi:nuclear transport factor 2 family protein [Pendulispora rubella]|uniref:Nuclear transport factor 2 family protein n=1 Tax=Pendulispora rubella TaxID=2741070 RepID=A0ABZ2LK11_9BACT
MSREDMDAVLAAHITAEAAHDMEGILATLCDDAVHQLTGVPGGLIQGREAIRERYAGAFAEFEGGDLQPVHRTHGDDYLIDEGLWHARHVASGRAVVIRLLHVCEFRDRRISKEIVWMDTAALAAQLGAPAP